MRPFRLRRDLTLLATPEGQKLLAALTTVTITGALDYQACDDKVCFNPASRGAGAIAANGAGKVDAHGRAEHISSMVAATRGR